MDSPDKLRRRIQDLAPIVAGLQQALAKLDLDETERAVLASIASRYASEYAAARRTLKENRRQTEQLSPKKNQEKRAKAKAVDEVQLSYKRQLDNKIEETHN